MKTSFFRFCVFLLANVLFWGNSVELASIQTASANEKKPRQNSLNPPSNATKSQTRSKPVAPSQKPAGTLNPKPTAKPQKTAGTLNPKPTAKPQKTAGTLNPKPAAKPQKTAGTLNPKPTAKPQKTAGTLNPKPTAKPQKTAGTLNPKPAAKPERRAPGPENHGLNAHGSNRRPPLSPHAHPGVAPPAPYPWRLAPGYGAPLFFYPPPVVHREIVVYSPSSVNEGRQYGEEAELNADDSVVSLDELADPMNRYYAWDAFRYYGWLQQYRPFHPSWSAATDAGIGFAAGYDLNLSRYHYYPVNCVRPGVERIQTRGESPLIFEPDDEARKILPTIQETLTASDVDATWDLIYEADDAFQHGKEFQAEEGYVRAMNRFPKMPDPYFRLAVIQISRLQYSLAAENVRKCLKFSQTWPASPFSLNRMYGSQSLKKNGDLASLQDSADQTPNDAELQALCGFMLYANALGDMEQGKLAKKYFERALRADPRLSGELDRLISFLDSEIRRVEND